MYIYFLITRRKSNKSAAVYLDRFEEIKGQLKSIIPIGWYRIPDIPDNNKIL